MSRPGTAVGTGNTEKDIQGSYPVSKPATEVGVLTKPWSPPCSSEVEPSLLRWTLLLLSVSSRS